MADHVKWGRPGAMGPHAALWPDTHPAEPPQAAHAASEVGHDDTEPAGQLFVGVFWAMVFLACCAALATLWWRSA
jgi:hypothetical protein